MVVSLGVSSAASTEVLDVAATVACLSFSCGGTAQGSDVHRFRFGGGGRRAKAQTLRPGTPIHIGGGGLVPAVAGATDDHQSSVAPDGGSYDVQSVAFEGGMQ